MPLPTSSEEPLVVGRCGYQLYHMNLKDCIVVFDHPAMPNRKLPDMTIIFTTTREKIFIVTGDRD
jgi:hypothetical protein